MENNRPATFFLSVDVAEHVETRNVLADIAEMLRQHQVQALWSFEFHPNQQLRTRVASAACDFGLLANSTWAHSSSDRTQFARELLARANRAADLGIKPIALTMPSSESPSHFDLLVKHHMAIIRTRTDRATQSAQPLQPRLSRYGIWEAAPTLVLPLTPRWSWPWTAKRTYQRATNAPSLIHVAVNVAAIVEKHSTGLLALDYVLRLANARRDAGELQMVSARELLEMHCPRRERVASRSVLRAA